MSGEAFPLAARLAAPGITRRRFRILFASTLTGVDVGSLAGCASFIRRVFEGDEA